MKDKMVYKGDNVVGALMNVPIFVGTFSVMTNFAVLEDMDAYRDEGMGDIIVGKSFLREVGIKTKCFKWIITLYNGDDEVTYQMVRSHPRFKNYTNEQCNKIPPLLKFMRTKNSYFLNNSNVTIPRRCNRNRVPNVVEPEIRTIVEVVPMAERTMEELLRAPTEGYGEAIVLPKNNADHFEIKTNLLQLVQANPFYGRESENPHAHINSFKRITSTLRFRNVPVSLKILSQT
ncbi:hypothetical protein Tco_1148613 [Tanacetum coccineum]